MDNKFTTLKTFSHNVGKKFWHIEFGTKYRYNMFKKFKQEHLIEACIRKTCKNHKIEIHTLYVMPDHIHMLVTLPHNLTDSKAMFFIKGGSAFLFLNIMKKVD